MSMQKPLLIELSREKQNTQRVLQNLEGADFDYKPHPKSMSLGELVNHIVELHNWVELALTKDVFNFHTDYKSSKLTTAKELLSVLEEGYERNKMIIETTDDKDFLKPWKLVAGEHVIAEMPKESALRFIVTNHLIHHRGQLTVYMRLLNIPVPGVYGPSADDK